MPRRPLRLAPPPLPADPALAWTLLRAFGPREAAAPVGVDGAAAARTAVALDLGARIASRVGPATLAAELGAPAAVAQGMRLLELARDLAGLAARAQIRIAWLKFAALDASGVEVVGRRAASDLDLLASPDDARELHRALVAEGFVADATRPPDHHLPALVHPVRGAVEIHVRLPGVRVGGGRRSADFGTLLAQGRLLPGRDARALVPDRTTLVAHLVAHALGQHALAPHGYPLTRVAADLADLDAGARELDADVARWIAGEVAGADLAALVELVRALAAGAEPRSLAGSRAGLWLAHLTAGALDPEYGRSLRLRAALVVPSDEPRWLRPWLALWRTTALDAATASAIYGPSRRRGELAARRLLRPFDLVRRAWASWRARRRLRGTRPGS